MMKSRSISVSPLPMLAVVVPPGVERLLAPGVSIALKVMHYRHRQVFERLAEYGERRYLIDPVDLPFIFLLMPSADHPSIRIVRADERPEADVTVRGPLSVLLTLLQGRADGDALFFSREIEVEGDTAAVVALRNAVDGEGIDLLSDFAGTLGPLAPLVVRAAGQAGAVAGHFARCMGVAVASLLAPYERRMAAQVRAVEQIEARLAAVERGNARRRA